MFIINDDKSIYITRGDAASFTVTAERDGAAYVFQPSDVVRFKVFEKKGCDCVMLQKDFLIETATETVGIELTRVDTKIGDIIHKPKDYWYEVELNPETHPQTIIGYDEDGAKVFRLLPEGKDEIGGEEQVDEQRHIYQQMERLVEESKDIAQSVRDDADNGEFDGEKGEPGITPHIGENGDWYIGEDDTGVKARCEDVSVYAQDLVTNGVYVADDPDAMLCKPVDGTETNNAIRFRAEPGVLYINGVRKKIGAASVSMKTPETERIRAFGYRLYEETGVIRQIMWDVEITTDADGNEIITAIDYDPDFLSTVLPVREGGIYDILIYTVTVSAGATQATQDMIRDLRGDERYCGFVQSKLDDKVTAGNIKAALGYTPADEETVDALSATIADYETLTLGYGTDGKLYIFKNGATIGNGIEIAVSGDATCVIDENNNLIISGAPDGTYTMKYQYEDGTFSDSISVVVGDVIKYLVTWNLTGVTSDNTVAEVIKGESLTVNLTANGGYELSSVVVTMGCTDITSSAVSGGKISIASVTGDIVITAVAEEVQTGPTNLADPTSADWQEGYRLSISSGDVSECEGHTVTNFIPAKMGDVLRVKGLSIVGKVNSQDAKIVGYNSSKTKISGLYGSTATGSSNYGNKVTTNGDISTITVLMSNTDTQIATSDYAYIRIDGMLMDNYTKNDVIITINEEIA